MAKRNNVSGKTVRAATKKKPLVRVQVQAEWVDYLGILRNMFRDAQSSAGLVSRGQIRYLVDTYYQMQHYRIAAHNQVRQAVREPCEALRGVYGAMDACEKGIRSYLGRFADSYTTGLWCRSIVGVGPVITAALLAHLDIRKARTVGHFYSFAGLNPDVKWERGRKRPWNARLRAIMYLAGECFVRTQHRAGQYYGSIYAARKKYEIDRNERGDNREQAARQLADKNIGKETECHRHLTGGKLPPAQIHARARRYAAKIFLSHVHHVMYVEYYGTEPPVPFAFEHCPGDHRHVIPVPNFPHSFAGRSIRELLDLADEPPATAPALEEEPLDDGEDGA